MSKSGLIDMHTHTCYSDGELTPNELVEKADTEGLDTIAIMGHDTLLGVQNMTIPKDKRKVNVINGIEVYHSNHSEEDEKEFLRFAAKYNLLICCGSDYYGPTIKPDVELGTGRGNVKVKQLTLLDAISRRHK